MRFRQPHVRRPRCHHIGNPESRRNIAPAFEAIKGSCRRRASLSSLDPVVEQATDFPLTLSRCMRDCRRVHGVRDLVEAGGMMSYGPNFPDLFRRAAGDVDKILRGVKPAEIPGRATNQVRTGHQPQDRKALGLEFRLRYLPAPTR